MLDNLSQARAAYPGRGPALVVCFWSRELGGLASGLLSEWMTKRTAGAAYLETLSVSEDVAGLPTKIAEVKKQLRRILGRMEHAIANHDFPKARLHCEAERATRERLNDLLSSYDLAPKSSP
jgi:hypothetical protein